MTCQEDSFVTMEGYLEKKGKMKLVSTWKRYWFVLKGQLLLYYKSQRECGNLSACRGSLNMGTASCVRPGGPPANGTQGYTIEVVTRSQVITLRTKDRSLHEQWLKALFDSSALLFSTPIKNSIGPMHFRYSLDNLPVLEEGESHDRTKDKKEASHHQNSVTNHESMLQHMKRIGCTFYGGSLDTVVKCRTDNCTTQQAQQQTNIPCIKVVDKVLGENNSESKYEEEEELPVIKDISPINNNEQCLKNTTNIQKQCNINSPFREKTDISITIDTTECGSMSEYCKISKNGNNENINKSSKEEKKQSYVTEYDTKAINSITNKDNIVIENKLYEKVVKIDNEENDESEVELRFTSKNSLYIDSEDERRIETVSDAGLLEEQLMKSCKKLYEEVKSPKTKTLFEKCNYEEDEYYSQYDMSLFKSLSDAEQEPDLPPRPSMGTELVKEDENSSPSETTLKTTSSSSHLILFGVDSHSTKKSSKLHSKVIPKKKKSPSKESAVSEDGCTKVDNQKKRKMSILRRMLKHYHKKPESESSFDYIGDSGDPEYETVDYAAAHQQKSVKEGSPLQSQLTLEKSSNPEKKVQKEKLFGRSLFSSEAMEELRMKLRVQEDSVCSSSGVIHEDSGGYEHISSDEITVKKPVPTPRAQKQKTGYGKQTDGQFQVTKFRCSDFTDQAKKPPKLPPRKVARPRSPWHDIPKNNSLIYRNVDYLINTSEWKHEESPNKESMPQTWEWDQEIGDELLGTPKGFFYIQNKWKSVEKSNELAQKGKCSQKNKSSGENKMKHDRIASSGSADKKSDKSYCKNVDPKSSRSSNIGIYTEISAKTIIDNINLQSEKHNEIITGALKNEEVCKGISSNETFQPPVAGENRLEKSKIERESDCTQNIITEETGVTLTRHRNNMFSLSTHDVISHINEIIPSCQDYKNDSLVTHDTYLQTKIQLPAISSSFDSLVNKNTKKCRTVKIEDLDEEEYDIRPRLNRHSDELNLLLAQLAKITSAPLLPQEAATSLVDRQCKLEEQKSSLPIPPQPDPFVLDPIRRRRHSDPDYDVPRPHGSLLHILASQAGHEHDAIEATHFLGNLSSGDSSLSLGHNVISAADDQPNTSYYVSMAPDSLQDTEIKDFLAEESHN